MILESIKQIQRASHLSSSSCPLVICVATQSNAVNPIPGILSNLVTPVTPPLCHWSAVPSWDIFIAPLDQLVRFYYSQSTLTSSKWLLPNMVNICCPLVIEHSYRKWPKHGDFPVRYLKLPEGNIITPQSHQQSGTLGTFFFYDSPGFSMSQSPKHRIPGKHRRWCRRSPWCSSWISSQRPPSHMRVSWNGNPQ